MARLTPSWAASMQPALLLLSTLLFLFLSTAVTSTSAASPGDKTAMTQVYHMGITYPAFSSLSNASYFTRHSHLLPRFQRLLRHGQDPNDKTQTAILVAGRPGHDDELSSTEAAPLGARVISALNPRNGEPVWRRIHNTTDPVTSMHTVHDVLVTLSGIDRTRVALYHALSGQELWTKTMDVRQAHVAQGVSEAAIVPLPYTPQSGANFAAAAPDVIVMDRDGTLQRFAGVNGRVLWVTKAATQKTSQEEGALSPIPIKVHATQQRAVVVYLVPLPSSKIGSLFSSSSQDATYSLQVDVFSTRTGKRLSSSAVPGSQVDLAGLPFPMQVHENTKMISNVAILGRDASRAEKANQAKPELVWLQRDGSVKAFDLSLPVDDIDDDNDDDGLEGGETKSIDINPSAISTVKPRQASRFVSLSEVPTLTNRGYVVAACDNGRGEVLRVGSGSIKTKGIVSAWEFEEEALDSVYSGSIDRKGNAFVNRIFFSSGQKLLNFHVFWADAHEGEGQVTGQSFQYDHDLHGDVLAAPFEVSQVSAFQLVTRATFITGSASIRMVQEDRHMWIREDGLSHTTASLLIDLPEANLGVAAAAAAADAATSANVLALQGEGFLARLHRHTLALQHLPAWTKATLARIAHDLPGSMDNFKALPLPLPGMQKSAAADTADSSEMWKLPQNTMAQQQQQEPQQQKPLQKRPLGGVAAAELSSPKRMAPPPGIPEVTTRRVTKQQKPDDIPPPTSLAPRVADRANVTATLVRDAFGLRKLLVATSEKGKIYAMDSQTGRFIWEKSLVGFGDGEGAPVPKVEIKMLALTRPIGGAPVATAAASSSLADEKEEEEREVKQASAQLEQGGLLTIVALVKPPGGITVTRMWEIDPLTGEFPGQGADQGQTGAALFVGDSKDSFLLPLQVDAEGSGQSIVGIVEAKTNDLHLHPNSPSVLSAFASLSSNFVFSIVEEANRLVGYAVVDPTAQKARSGRSTFTSEKVWQVLFDEGDEVVEVARSTSLKDAIASQGKVLGNRQTMYKYLNPHALVVVTRNVLKRSAKVYVVDGITGTILYESVVAPEGKLAVASATAAKPTVAFTENWITVSASIDVEEGEALAEYKGKHTQTRILSIELYDVDATATTRAKDEKWKWKGIFSSFTSAAADVEQDSFNTTSNGLATSPIQVFSQVYVLPYTGGLRALVPTRTRHGITQKALLAASASNGGGTGGGGFLVQLPRRLLDPRRIVARRKPTTAELEEGLSPYEAYIHDDAINSPGGASSRGRLRFATGIMQEADTIVAAPALLESTTVVFVKGLDWLVGSVSPSGTFDVLSASFNKAQLILTVIVLSAGLAITKPMVAAKQLKARW